MPDRVNVDCCLRARLVYAVDLATRRRRPRAHKTWSGLWNGRGRVTGDWGRAVPDSAGGKDERRPDNRTGSRLKGMMIGWQQAGTKTEVVETTDSSKKRERRLNMRRWDR
jgi:hypothetical protein